MPSLEEQGGRSLSSPEQLLAHLLYDTHRDKLWAGVEYRQRILRRWKIAAGSSVLEIGCGQGEFTVCLADAVGPTGSIVAVDLACPGWGI
jgi:predicted methyltransferase